MTTKRIRVGILGVHPDKGWATLAHVPALRSLSADYEIVAITSNSLENARRAAHQLDIPHALTTTAELVAHPEVDLVVVTVKVSNHLELVAAAISAGKAVSASGHWGSTSRRRRPWRSSLARRTCTPRSVFRRALLPSSTM